MYLKQKLSILSYILLIALTVTGGIFFGNFLAHPFEGTDGDFLMAEIDDTGGTAKVNILIVGLDKSEGLSDVIMVARYDEEHNKLNVMSIPRDTYVRFGTSTTALINSAYSMRVRNEDGTVDKGGINLLSKKVTELTGLGINYYVIFKVGTFEALIDLLGGVEFDVPQNMNYDDPAQDLHIHINKGFQTLNGHDAEGLVRFRSYPAADLKRVEVQQDLLKAILQQKLSAEYITKIPEIYSAMQSKIMTNLTLPDMLMYAKSMLNLDLETGVSTHTMPTMFTRFDGHLTYNIQEVDRMMEEAFDVDGPIVGRQYTAETE